VRQSLNLEGAVYSGLLQTDAAINRGNSGGPLVNIRGEVMGINTAIYAPTGVFAGIGFAIPSNRVKDIMDQLISQGRVSRGWMGVEILSVNSVIADQFGLEKPEGVMINNVAENSPASRAGLRRGDVVVDFDGQPTPTQDVLLDLVGKMKPTSTVRVGIIREKQKRTVSLTLAETPSGSLATPLTPDPTAPPIKSLDWEGARIGSLTPTLASRLGVPIDIQGVVVVSMPSAGGLANDLGLREGDVVVAVNRHPTPTVTMFQKIIKNLSAKEGLLLDVNRRGRQIFLSYQSGE